MNTYLKTLSSTDEIKEAPEYIKVLPLGYVTSVKGNFTIDTESFEMMKAHMQSRKIDIVIDYEHQTLGNGQAPAAGWIKELILRSDGIYAKVDWTQPALNYLWNNEYRFLSPVVMVRDQDNKVVQLHSAALTNTPAINGMTPIINSIKLNGVRTEPDQMQSRILQMLNLSEADYKKYRHREG